MSSSIAKVLSSETHCPLTASPKRFMRLAPRHSRCVIPNPFSKRSYTKQKSSNFECEHRCPVPKTTLNMYTSRPSQVFNFGSIAFYDSRMFIKVLFHLFSLEHSLSPPLCMRHWQGWYCDSSNLAGRGSRSITIQSPVRDKCSLLKEIDVPPVIIGLRLDYADHGEKAPLSHHSPSNMFGDYPPLHSTSSHKESSGIEYTSAPIQLACLQHRGTSVWSAICGSLHNWAGTYPWGVYRTGYVSIIYVRSSRSNVRILK